MSQEKSMLWKLISTQRQSGAITFFMTFILFLFDSRVFLPSNKENEVNLNNTLAYRKGKKNQNSNREKSKLSENTEAKSRFANTSQLSKKTLIMF